MSKTYKGSCLCGGIRFSVNGLSEKAANCYCSMCRKFHGAAYATFAQAKRENFHWLTGETSIKNYVADNGTVRKFCKDCGSSLIFADDIFDTVYSIMNEVDGEQYPEIY